MNKIYLFWILFLIFNINSLSSSTFLLSSNFSSSEFPELNIIENNEIATNAICQDITVQLDATGNATILASQIDNGSTGLPGFTLTIDISSFNCTNIGVNTVTLTATDSDNSTSCTATVTIIDNSNPITPTLTDVTGECSATATAPTTTDNCSGTLTGTTSDALTYSTQGTHTINWTFDDGNGNSISVPQNVVIDDMTDPVTQTLVDVTGECSATATAPTTTDNCSGTLTGTTSDALSYSTQGTHTINWTFDDGNGNSIIVPQNVVIDDMTDPVIPTLVDVTGECSATATAPTTTDNCSGTLTGTTSDALTYSAQGTHTINWTFDDGNGNSISVPQNVVIDDMTDPVIPTLVDVTGECSATATAPTTTDNCSGTLTGTTSDALSYSAQGTHTINWIFDDGNGNSIIVPQNVVIDDMTDPVIPTLVDVTGECSATATAPTTTDNCSGTLTGTTSDALTYSAQGTHTINWTFDDGNGNSISVPQNVVIDDMTDPVIPTLVDVTGECSATATAPTTTDNCSGTLTGTTSDALSYSAQGTHTINWIFDDGNGNSISVPQNVVIDDITDPVIPTLVDVTGECSATATVPTTTDNCSGTLTGTTSDALSYSAQGTHTINWTFDDGNGNTISVPQNVVIDDMTDPVIPTLVDVTGECSATATAPTTTDNCSGTLTGTTSDALTYSAQGTHTINWTFDDGNGNSISVPQNVVIDDMTDPVIPTLVDVTGECSATATAPTTTDNCSGTLTGTTSDALSYSAQGTHTINWTFDDGNGNSISVPQNVVIDDMTDPDTPTLPIINGQCSATATAPTTNDNCSGTLTGTTSDPLTYSTQGAHVITWTFDDGNGNSIDVDQTVFINDTIDPIAICQNITIPLNNTTGTATINGSQIDNGSSDNCGNITFSLSQSTFDCTNIGPNIVVLTITDGNGNTDTCTATVTVTSPNINGGTLVGYLTNTETAADADDIIEVTACPDEPQNGLLTLSGHSGNIVRWESSINGGLTWTTIANTTNTYNYINILETTIIRVVIQIGSCQAYSTLNYVVVVPPDVPPTIIGPDEFTICLGTDVIVEAESAFGVNNAFNNGGMFNQANLNNLGWEVDGAAEMSAGGNNTNDTYWKETNGPKKFNGRCYDSTDNSKFAIVSGTSIYDAPDHTIAPLSTLETPIFNTLGLTSAHLEFDQAYYLEAGAWCSIELSVDGGANYNITLDPGAAYNYTGPSDTGFGNVGFNGQCRRSPGTYIDNHVSIDLQNYIGMTGLRIKFTYSGTNNSAWALDNITIPDAPIDEVIEWTDANGIVVTTGSTTTITPVTPGIQTYGVTSLINGCRAEGDEGTEFVSVNASLSYAGENIIPIAGECGEPTIQLAAYDNALTALQNFNNGTWNNNYVVPDIGAGDTDFPGTGENGFWTVTSTPTSCGGTYTFSDVNSPTSTFTGEPGDYTLTWTVNGCSSDVDVTLDNCESVDFDGVNDYITFDDNFNVGNSFSLEAWVKPQSIGGLQTIFSKRDANNLATGYDLILQGNIVSFNWDLIGSIKSTYPIDTSRWYHISVTFNSGIYNLYIDGIQVSNPVSGSSPSSNSRQSILGAMDQTGAPPNKPVNYFNGWIDELRIWNNAISQAQLQQMMNQEIMDNTAVRGEIVPLDIPGLNWNDLDGYYRMQINCGYLTPLAGNIPGKLRNIYSAQQETAPLPYTSNVDGQNWSVDNTWTHFNVWDTPNSIGIDGSTPIDWNIVQISHDVSSGDKDIIVLGLISDTLNKELIISDPSTTQDETNDGQSLRITHYLELDGDIDLMGESQLLQDEGSILAITSAGKLERDQQGTTNLYNYNYWSSPVSTRNISANNTDYSVNGMQHDGSNSSTPTILQWTSSHDANGSTSPITLSNRWLYAYENFTAGSYAAWRALNQNDLLATGLGYTMKGSGSGDPINDIQNYVFIGKPNNGTITNPITIGNEALVGNPYASAVDADEFIRDNIPGGNAGTSQSIDGTLYFWEHYTSNITHVLEDYEGGYATYNLIGGNPAVSPPLVSGLGTPSKLPGRYIPVSQGFFVNASAIGGDVTFNNDQRTFVRETPANSTFIRSSNSSVTNRPDASIKRIRLDFKTQEGANRPLLLGFVSDGLATDDFDYGYDAENTDEGLPNDASWLIDDNAYTTQGVGEFDTNKQYPLGLFLSTSGEIQIELNEIENFDSDIDVFVYDALLGTYTLINDSNFTITLEANNYTDRFFITFTSESLSIDDVELNDNQIMVNYLNDTDEIYLNSTHINEVKHIKLINMLGQTIYSWNDFETVSNEIRIPVNKISSGTYIVSLKTEFDKTVNKKVIIKN